MPAFDPQAVDDDDSDDTQSFAEENIREGSSDEIASRELSTIRLRELAR